MFSTEKILYMDSQTMQQFMALWEAAFKPMHPALAAPVLEAARASVEEALQKAKDITCIKDAHGRILAFMYTKGNKIEMLYVHPGAKDQGVDSMLVTYAVSAQKVRFVDVSAQDTAARTLFEQRGFQVYEQAEADSLGNPLPTLRMRLA